MAPAFPLKNVMDPTGAGDSFAGGLIGSLAWMGAVNEINLRKAVIYGTVMASYNVEDFSINRLQNITINDINRRFQELKKITFFDDILINQGKEGNAGWV